jgi:hypothetical protein
LKFCLGHLKNWEVVYRTRSPSLQYSKMLMEVTS